MENTQPTVAVSFGRHQIPHPGHADLIRKMLEVADMAYVGISVASSNNRYINRREVLHALCNYAGLDMERIRFFWASSPFDTVQDFAENYNDVTVVLGVDQTQLGETLSKRFEVKFVPNEVRIGSSTVIRYFLEEGEYDIVREIYYGDSNLYDQVVALRDEELSRQSGN